MSSLPAIITLSGLAIFLYKQLINQPKQAPVAGEDFLIQDLESNKITDTAVINAVQSGMLGWNGVKPGGAQFW